jgi:hypothetical protein
VRATADASRLAPAGRPVGTVTRGTTSPRRLRRVDRWLAATYPRGVGTPRLLAVDLGFGARPFTTLELAARLRRINPGARVVGLEIDPERVAAAAPYSRPGVEFAVGGFELGGLQPHLVRALNVLRQYDEADVADAWARMQVALAPGGLVVEGTCDEAGRLGAWVAIAAGGPTSLTLATDLALTPSAVAARLPKALIHHNVQGQPIHTLLATLDAAWQRSTSLAAFSPRQRFAAAVAAVRADGWPIVDGAGRWRRGEVTVTWDAIRPIGR